MPGRSDHEPALGSSGKAEERDRLLTVRGRQELRRSVERIYIDTKEPSCQYLRNESRGPDETNAELIRN
jgi:hypothetical protein